MRTLICVAVVSSFALGCSDDMGDPDTGPSDTGVMTGDSGDAGDTGGGDADADAAPDTCGDGTIQPDDVCDGADLGGEDCETLGFSPGTLGCLADCSDYDTSMCGCEPGTTSCGMDGRTLQTCGTDRMIDPSMDVACDFICDAGACADASNVPSAEMAACDDTAPALILDGTMAATGMIIDAAGTPQITCAPDCGDGSTTTIDGTLVSQADPSDPQLAIFCVSELRVDASTMLTADFDIAWIPVFVSDGDVDISGEVSVSGETPTTIAGAPPRGGPGAGSGGMISGVLGADGEGTGGGGAGENGTASSSAGGGAGFGTAGGMGAKADMDMVDGGAGGIVYGTAELVPLLAGSGGGAGAGLDVMGRRHGGGGGGGLQIVSRGTVSVSGVVSATGARGRRAGSCMASGAGGGGSGGALLVEAGQIDITGSLTVDGGNGGGAGPPAGMCPGGAGATADMPATDGGGTLAGGGGGGGGGGGRVYLADTMGVSCSTAVSPEASCAAGTLSP